MLLLNPDLGSLLNVIWGSFGALLRSSSLRQQSYCRRASLHRNCRLKNYFLETGKPINAQLRGRVVIHHITIPLLAMLDSAIRGTVVRWASVICRLPTIRLSSVCLSVIHKLVFSKTDAWIQIKIFVGRHLSTTSPEHWFLFVCFVFLFQDLHFSFFFTNLFLFH